MENYQNILFPYAYNVLGSSEDAKDAIQDVLSNFISSSKKNIENEKSYLIKGVINRSINIKKRKKKLVRDEVWLPEPYATEESDTDINLRDIASYSLLVLLERLSPKERAVFILKEGFAYSHEEIAEVLSGTIENSRKLLNRAKGKLNTLKSSEKAFNSGSIPSEIIESYINAIRERDTKKLEKLLSKEITFVADGGGKVNVVKKRCFGCHEVISLVIFAYHTFNTSSSVYYSTANHEPALLYYKEDKLQACQIFSIHENKVIQINTILDPEKLQNMAFKRPTAI